MYASASDVQANLGRPLTEPEKAQTRLWISWAESMIAERMGSLDLLNPVTVQRVIVEAVTVRLRQPDPVVQVQTSVDDTSTSRTYTRSTGMIEITEQMWAELGWYSGGAFTVAPYGAPDARR